jgi:acyl-CoA thioesterase I
MNRPILLLALAWLVSCEPADDAGTARPRSTGGDEAAPSARPGSPLPAPDDPRAGAPAEAPARVVFLGTSLTAGLGLLRNAERFTDLLQEMADSAGVPVAVVNAGLSGDTSAGGLRRLAWVLQEPAEVLVVELGANDGLRGQSVETMEENLDAVIRRARELSPGVRIVLVPMEAPPNMGGRYTAAFRQVFFDLAARHDVSLTPFLLEGIAGVAELNQDDRIHPTAEGHRRIARALWDHLEPVFREAALAARSR